ncbi:MULTISPECIES: low molecular weight protein-tyrosine-phosphatase [unclassified Halomonas]|uniref:low molecular weight protein-tyrosine-phosphatase n=1 Tax=unclassified Halomonas TaxID=2609666 RepID=UPI0021E4913B|nr:MULTISPECIES: low molecular weight protein-tyrosine-phosphatase [unclassified Halomonas]UYF99276.1 low molecular weight phosphotyrosine protein phosphatase [Halomonas sp. GD1P12]WNL39567.1 low molecular weight protein-tyrosine-phosphatase [Halomonas sp. PAMB 3232]WNL42924.1 low molecular weight protein-tyrosine-phosphatase [Halomonas sp. PAMB 3264]
MFQRILVVCVGNICRSPVAEAMLRQRLPGRQFSSAGLGALVGSQIDAHARVLAERDGLEVDNHQARQLTREMLDRADLILVMSDQQRLAVAELSPAALGKTMRLGQWLENGRGKDIPDPYRKSAETFQHVHQLMDQAVQAWALKLA